VRSEGYPADEFSDEFRKEESLRKRCFARFAIFAFNVILSQALKACATAVFFHALLSTRS